MIRSARAGRKERIMGMSAKGPSLVPIPIRNPSTYFDAETMKIDQKRRCQQAVDDMLRSRSIECFNEKDYFDILAILRQKRCALAREHRLLECMEIDDLMAQLSDYFFENKLYTSKAQEVAAIEAQLEAVKNKLEAAEEKWWSEMSRKYQKKERDVIAKQQLTTRYLQEYDNKIDQELPPEYCKLSTATLELREREKHLIGSRRFEEASKVHAEFERAQKKELVKRREEYCKRFEKRRENVITRNSKIMNACETDWERKISHAEFLKDKELQPLRESVANLESKLKRAKAEYIGEDDPIVRMDDVKPSLRATTRDLPPKGHKVPTKQKASNIRRENTKLDSTRWPPKPRR
ncbi:hypothetical protein TRFO_03502 [Tritrichomonas foetus]|uniref:Uncharacterized protein n=1 Tax=Tritrichomonas foetus TaxID=1144522 RepID=A0A1J4KQ86_9EUKA|nr:hypothetical protein TRFO_03502 [Tritrichomonas foetus]|eukprot:OHT13072.1 hypothetical protein TRFO_03502 [Tritrichomonas foetus]